MVDLSPEIFIMVRPQRARMLALSFAKVTDKNAKLQQRFGGQNMH